MSLAKNSSQVLIDTTNVGADPKDKSMSVMGKAIRKAHDVNTFKGTTQYRAVVLTDAVEITSDKHKNMSGLNLSDSDLNLIAAGDPKSNRYQVRCRIVEENSPHQSIPPPSSLNSNPEDAQLIALHQTFTTRGTPGADDVAPNKGDVVWVTFEKGPADGRLLNGQVLPGRQGSGQGGPSSSPPSAAAACGPGGGGPMGAAGAGPVVGAQARAAALAAGVPAGNINDFYSDVIRAAGGTPNDETLKFFGAWGNLEQPRTTNNPLATTHPGKDRKRGGCRGWSQDSGMSTFNSACVRNYSSFEAGVQATSATLGNGYYKNINAFLNGTLTDASGNTVTTAIDALAHPGVQKDLDRWGSKGHKVFKRLSQGMTDNPNTHIDARST